jgi:hypothetical protein
VRPLGLGQSRYQSIFNSRQDKVRRWGYRRATSPVRLRITNMPPQNLRVSKATEPAWCHGRHAVRSHNM